MIVNPYSGNVGFQGETTNMILARSVSGYAQVSAKVEELKNEERKKENKVFLLPGAVIFVPMVLGMSKNEWERDTYFAQFTSSSTYTITVFFLIAAFFVCTAIIKGRRERLEEIDGRYKYFASLESLVADGEKIYGTTIRGPIALYYNQIESTGIFVQPWEIASNDTVTVCDAFAVRDTAGNSYQFYSFQNCNELKTVIDMKITETRNR